MKNRKRSENRELPLAIILDNSGHTLVAAVNKAAAEVGIFQGMSLTDARTCLPILEAVPADPIADALTLARVARWCRRYTPLTAIDGLDGVWLDTAGCAHLFGGEQAMLDDLIARLEYLGFTVCAALADTLGVASAVARYGISGTVVAQGCARRILAPLPMAALRLNAGMVADLSCLGLRSIGDLYEIPRAPLATRFGGKLLHRLDQALGSSDEPISSTPEWPRYHVRTVFADPISEHKAIVGGLERLIARICRRLEYGGHGCRRLEFTLYRTDGTLQQIQIGTSRPICSPRHLVRLFASGLDTLDPGFGFEALSLVASLTEPLTVGQSSFFSRLKESPSGEGDSPNRDIGAPNLSPFIQLDDVELSQLIDRLGNRLGFDSVLRLVQRESFLPERVVRTVSAVDSVVSCWSPFLSGPNLPTRPIRLLVQPEPVEALALMASKTVTRRDMWDMPDIQDGERSIGEEPPTLFRWRRVIHRVQNTEGPERITPEWWREDGSWVPGARDYWRVEDVEGLRFWLYREVRKKSVTSPRWFLHGLFA